MLRLSILILIQLTYTRSITNRYVTYYWKTTSATDRAVDYWNHGPIYIPGLQDVFPMTTKEVDDLFPPWLTTESKPTTNYELKDRTKTAQRIEETTPEITPTTTPIATTTVTETAEPTEHTTHDVTKTTQKTEATKRTTKALFDFEEAPINEDNITLSEFLRRVFRALAVKNYSELPPLFKPFNAYMGELLNDGDFGGLGKAAISNFKEWNEQLSRLIKSPDRLHAECYQAHLALSNRYTVLNESANNLLNFLDDMYDEAEEELMMFILQETIKFPNTNTTAEEIAYSFINNVFLNPWNRINGTSKQDTLVKMFTAFFGNKPNVTRRYAGNTNRHKRSRSDQHQKNKLRNALSKLTENNYEVVRSNVDNIDTYIDKLHPPSSDTSSAYEYEMRANYDETDIMSALKLKFENKTKKENNQISQVLRTNNNNIDSYDESSSENNDNHKPIALDYDRWKETNNIRSLFDKLENIFSNSSKSNGTPKESSIYFRGDNQRYTNFEHSFVPSRFLVTKLISKLVPYVGTPSLTAQHKKLRNTYFSDPTTPSITQSSKDPSSKTHKVTKYKIKRERDPHFLEIPRYQRQKKYPAHLQPIPVFLDKPVARVPYESKPADSNTDGQVQTAFKKQFNNQITKYTSSVKEIINQRDLLRHGDMKVPRVGKNRKNITKHNAGDQQHQGYLTDDSETYSETSPERLDKPSKYRKRKYERLKRKYNMLKRLNEKMLQNIVNSKLKQSTLVTISSMQSNSGTTSNLRENLDAKNATSNGSDEFYHRIYETTRKGSKKIKFNNINLFLKDYDGGVENESDIQEPQARLGDYRYSLRKSLTQNTITHNNTNVTEITTTDYSDTEKELKQNIYDALRHMDFVNYNASRRSEDGPVEVGSHETDLEAVLKTNIYKAVKKLLKSKT